MHEQLWLDGNALAGLLNEVLGTEVTGSERVCQSCGVVSAIGSHRLYQGAGAVLRCPECGEVALCIVTLPDRHIVRFSGTWRLEIPTAA